MTAPIVALIIPTYNASQDIPALFAGILDQSHRPDIILVIDSSSTDNTLEQLKQYPVIIHSIPKATFNHGATRQLATTMVKADIYIFLTQDAIPAKNDTFKNMIQPFLDDSTIGCSYGQQLAKTNATPLSTHARLFNYPENSHMMTFNDKEKYKIKTCFNSNSFAAYRKSALERIGGFKPTMMCEDMYAAAKMLMHDLKIYYNANAKVYHSHNFSLAQEFVRYQAIGIFHQQEPWIFNTFGNATAAGINYFLFELCYLIKQKKLHWIPRACLSTAVKYIGFKTGLSKKCL